MLRFRRVVTAGLVLVRMLGGAATAEAQGSPTLSVTVTGSTTTATWTAVAGATGYVVKHAPIGELLDAIRQVHLGGSPMSAGIARKVVNTFHQPSMAQEGLTQREQEVLSLIAEGLTVKEIADRTHVSNNTVRTHIRHIYEKLHVRSRVEAVNRLRGA